MKIVIDPSADAREIDREGDCSLTGNAGSRVISATLDDGTEIVRDGAVVPGDPVVLATINFLASGGDCYPLGDIEATSLGLTYQASLAQYITDELDGQITADAYPAGGEGRIVQMASEEPATAPSDEGTHRLNLPPRQNLPRQASSKRRRGTACLFRRVRLRV